MLKVAGDDLSVAALGEPGERCIVHVVAHGPDAAVAADELTHAGQRAAEALEGLPDRGPARTGVVQIRDQGINLGGGATQTGHPAEDPRELAVVDAPVLVAAPPVRRTDVLLPDQECVAGAVRDRGDAG